MHLVQWHVNYNYISTGLSDKYLSDYGMCKVVKVCIFVACRGIVLSIVMCSDVCYMSFEDEVSVVMMWGLSDLMLKSSNRGHRAHFLCMDSCTLSTYGLLLFNIGFQLSGRPRETMFCTPYA